MINGTKFRAFNLSATVCPDDPDPAAGATPGRLNPDGSLAAPDAAAPFSKISSAVSGRHSSSA
jgi:hypothetical protein